MKQALIFDIAMGQSKPESIRHRDAECPFCNHKDLKNILETRGSITWLMNKYPVLKGTWPTVIIETAPGDHREFSHLPVPEAAEILDFTLEKWEEVLASKRFKSVLCFKNFGPMSGGSIYHPHGQIVGLEDYDYHDDIKEMHFEGWPIYEDAHLKITLSHEPHIGFFEFNIIAEASVDRSQLVQRMQQIINYLLKGFSRNVQSYNYFFYNLIPNAYHVKIVPRYLTSPLYVGYGIPQVCNDKRAYEIISELKPFLFP